MEFFRDKDWDIVGKTRIWFAISAIVIVSGLITWGARDLNYGIDFTGGSLLRYAFEQPLASGDAQVPGVLAKVRNVLTTMGLGGSQIQVVGDDAGKLTYLYMRTPSVANDEEAAKRDREVMAGMRKAFPDNGEISDLGRETVGPVVGEELRNKAILALVLGSVLILIYITIRYEFRFAVAAIVALIHDTLIVMGFMALLQVELNSAFVAAILTVLGYSINDSVVIFDRIRENMGLHRRGSFAGTVNVSLLQTLARSINTTMTTLFVLIALYMFGGESISGFALALVVGITTGSYSSIFIASPIVVLWEGRAARARAVAVDAARGRGGAARATAADGSGPAELTAAEGAEAGAEGAAKGASQDVIERLQREEMQERKKKLDGELEEKRDERRARRKKEKARASKKSSKSKRRF